jgi:hypothetical protein
MVALLLQESDCIHETDISSRDHGITAGYGVCVHDVTTYDVAKHSSRQTWNPVGCFHLGHGNDTVTLLLLRCPVTSTPHALHRMLPQQLNGKTKNTMKKLKLLFSSGDLQGRIQATFGRDSVNSINEHAAGCPGKVQGRLHRYF